MGMAKEAAEAVPAAKQLFERASDILGYDLLAVCAEGEHRGQGAAWKPAPLPWAAAFWRCARQGGVKPRVRWLALLAGAAAWHATCWAAQLRQDAIAAERAAAPASRWPVRWIRDVGGVGAQECVRAPALPPRPAPPPGPKEKLDSTAVSQPAIYVASLAALEKFKAEQGEEAASAADVTCGLSLGEYTALTYAGGHPPRPGTGPGQGSRPCTGAARWPRPGW